MRALSAWARTWGASTLIVLAALGSVLEVALRDDARLPDTPLGLAVPAVALIALALLGWRKNPFVAASTMWLLAAIVSFVDGRLVVSTLTLQAVGLVASFLLGDARELPQARVGLGIVLLGAAVVVSNDPKHSGSEFVFVLALFAIAWAAGFVLRQRTAQGEAARDRAAQLEREQEEQARKAIAEERVRIARELHDVVGHCVSVMTVQASAVRRMLTPEQARERDALMTVERVGREALGEMRRLVGILRTTEDAPDLNPQPSLSDLNSLIAHAADSGLAVELRVEGEPLNLPTSVDLTAYRVVQEGLTNAIRHAHATRAQVRVCYGAGLLDIEVVDDGIGAGANGHKSGHGLLGMRERIDLFGGELEAGPRQEGGYRLRAQLPVPR